MSVTFAKVRVACHMEVVVIDVDHFSRVLVLKRVRERPANNFAFGKVGRDLEVHVVQLGWSKQRINSWWIDVVSDLFFHEANVVTLCLVKEWHSALNATCSLQCPPAFVIAREIHRLDGPTGLKRSQNWNASVPFVNVKFVFEVFLPVR